MKRFILIFLLVCGSLDAAITPLYFSTAANGAGDATSWANRAQFVNAGTISTYLTTVDWAGGANSAVVYLGPGTYTLTAAITTTTFTGAGGTAPTATNPMIFHGCDSSGNPLVPPDPDWLSCEPSWDDSGLPVIATTTNVASATLLTGFFRLIKFTASGRNAGVINGAAALDWCSIVNSTANTASDGITASILRVQNCLISMTGSSYNAAVVPQSAGLFDNCRIIGVTGSSGDRRGIENGATSTAPLFTRCTVYGFGGDAIGSASTNAGQLMIISSSVLANNGGTGLEATNTATQTATYQIRNCMITGNGGYGIDGLNEANILALTNRLRDNASGNITALDNYPTDLGNYTTDSDDATEYVDAGSGDFTIKSSATIATMGFGVAVQNSGGQSSYSY